MKLRGWIGAGIAAAAVSLSLFNASWIAPKPSGRLIVVAQRGIVQPLRAGADPSACAATQIQPPGDNLYIENSLRSLYKSSRIGADAVEVDVRRSRDGHAVVFRDDTLNCRTNGQGLLADRTLAELKALDIGYGYTADGGASFPLRGRGIAALPTVEETLRELRGVQLVFHLRGRDPADADALVAGFAGAGAEIGEHHAFYGDPAVLARLKRIAPRAWTFDPAGLGKCPEDYPKLGWLGVVPQSCRHATVGVPIDGQWTIWGWPYRFLARIAAAGSRVLVYRSRDAGGIQGLDRPEQYDRVPRAFKGHLFVDDFGTVGPSLRR
ncbi:MAG TPA: glycerophosphodiester phosphodiesterase family protein [Allosphingosinicella sp.]|nr:glycerophosphodiester phosphodiesterase family protein [Allosphingosinicella sp.]